MTADTVAEPQVIPVNGAAILVSGEGEISHVIKITKQFKGGPRDEWLTFPGLDGPIFDGMVERGIGRTVRQTVVVFSEVIES